MKKDLSPFQKGLLIFGGVITGTVIWKAIEASYTKKAFADLKDALVEGLTEGAKAAKEEVEEAIENIDVIPDIPGSDTIDTIGDVVTDIAGEIVNDGEQERWTFD